MSGETKGEQLESDEGDDLSQEFQRHQEQIRIIAADPHAHWTLNLIAEDERHYANLLKILKQARAQTKSKPES